MLRSFWGKILGKEDVQKPVQSGWEFNYAMDFVRQTLQYEQSKQNQIIILEYMLGIIKEDLKNDLLTTILYNKENFDKKISHPFPIYYEDEAGSKIWAKPDEEKMKKVDLANDCVLVLAWHRDRMRNIIKIIAKNSFEYIKGNHLAYYYTGVDLCFAYNGTHSISAGIGHKKGFIEAKTIDIIPMFDHVYTDGDCWYNQHNGNRLGELYDFRVGIIYEISKIKYRLENEEDTTDLG